MKHSLAPILFSSLVLTACGGGSDATVAPPIGNPGGTVLAITGTNGAQASNSAWQSANQTANLIGLAGSGGIVSSSADVSSINPVSQAQAVAGSTTVLSALSLVPFGPIEQDCMVSGSITISGDLTDSAVRHAQRRRFFRARGRSLQRRCRRNLERHDVIRH